MSAPKSDAATIEARKNRLLELLAEGKSQLEAAEILRREGYPADVRTVRRDVVSLKGQWGEQNMSQIEQWRDEHIAELRELREKLEYPLIRPAEKIALALTIIREDSRIKGTAAPSKSIHATVSGPQLDALYLEIRQELLDLTDDDKQEALFLMREFAKSRKKPVVVDAMPLQPIERSLTDGTFS
jgi:hypothetical protein